MLFSPCKRLFSFMGRRSIPIPPNTNVTILPTELFSFKQPANTFKTTPIKSSIKIKGPLGELAFPLHEGLLIEESPDSSCLNVKIDQQVFSSIRKPCQKFIKGMWGTTATNVRNCIKGVNDGFYIPIKLVGVGYKATFEGQARSDVKDDKSSSRSIESDKKERKLILKLGFSNDIEVTIPPEIDITIISNTKFLIHGIDFKKVSQLAYNIRRYRKPEPYNGKGIFVDDETIILKQKKKK